MPPDPTPRGVRNNNYLNIKNVPGDPWLGSIGTDPQGHAIFGSPVYGIRAGIITMRTYYIDHGLHTILAILSRWAPASDTLGSLPGNPLNSPTDYANFVSAQLAISANVDLLLFSSNGSVSNSASLEKLLAAMAQYENYKGFSYPAALFTAALSLVYQSGHA